MQISCRLQAFTKWMILAASTLFSIAAFACKPTAVSEVEFAANASSLGVEEIKKVVLLGEKIRFHPIGVVALTAYSNKKTSLDLAKRRLEFVRNLLANVGVPEKYICQDIKPPFVPALINSIDIEAEYMPPGACPPPSITR